MNSLYNQQLGKLIDLDFKKMVTKKNKKIVSTSIFLPELPSVNIKTNIYILGMIKTVENFSKNMGKDWILRVYYDSMFDKGITLKELEKVASEDMKKSELATTSKSYALVAAAKHDIKKSVILEKTVKASKSYANATKRKPKRVLSHQSSPYEYEYNKVTATNKSDKKETIVKNKVFLKKILKMVHLYFQHILDSNEDRYKNIELISYDCQKASNYPGLIGHPATFGSIIRFLPLYDENVSMFFCINSRYPINNLQKFIIEKWEKNNEQKMLIYNYDNHAVGKRVDEELNKKAYKIKKTTKKINDNYKKDELIFIDFVDSMYKFKSKLFKSKKTKTFQNLETNYNDMLIGITYSGIDGQSRYPKYFESIAAGFFGYKKECLHHNERCVLFSKLLSYFIESKNEFIYGIDEVLLKIVIAFEIGTGTEHLNNIHFLKDILELHSNYIKILYRNETPCNKLSKLENKKDTFLETKQKDKIVLNEFIMNAIYEDKDDPDKIWRRTEKIKHFIELNDLLDIGILNSRSLYAKYDTKKDTFQSLKLNEDVYKSVCYNKKYDNINLTLFLLFFDIDEQKKLFMIDSSKKDNLNYLLNIEATYNKKTIIMNEFFSILDLNKIAQKDIIKALKAIILYYNYNHKLDILELKHPRQMGKGYYRNMVEYNSTAESESESNYLLKKSKKKKKYRFINNLIQTKKSLRPMKI
mgnify:CR=1 FL=1